MADPVSLPIADLAPAGPPTHRGPRGTILLHLKRDGQATAKDLAARLGVSLNAVRHHLKELEGEGVICYDRAHHGVGAPSHAYRLSAAGHALFPDRYERTVADLLDHVVQTEGRQAAVALLEAQYRSLATRLQAETDGLDGDARAARIADVLHQEGFMASWASSENGGMLTESNCPHRVVAERFPELCEAEEAFLAQVFGAAIERRSRIAGGCGTCSYHVAFEQVEGEVAR